MRAIVHRLLEWRITSALPPTGLPRHVGVIVDGNRRWARAAGFSDVTHGHRMGAAKLLDLMSWCQELGVEVVTVWLLSTDNLNRPADELTPLLRIIEEIVDRFADAGWRLHLAGAIDLLPSESAAALKSSVQRTADAPGLLVNVAVAYGGRQEIASAVRSLVQESLERGDSIDRLAERLDVSHIAEHLYTAGQPDPDLVIRTSGEQRLSGFLLWQTAHSELYFCDTYWPAFRRLDLLRAVRSFAQRQRRFGR